MAAYNVLSIADLKRKNDDEKPSYKTTLLYDYNGKTIWLKYAGDRILFHREYYVNFLFQWLLPNNCQRVHLVTDETDDKNPIMYLGIEIQPNFFDLYYFYKERYGDTKSIENRLATPGLPPDIKKLYEAMLDERLKRTKDHNVFEVGKGLEEIIFLTAVIHDADLKGLDSSESNVGVIVDEDDNIERYFRIDLDQAFMDPGTYHAITHHPVLLTDERLLEHSYWFKQLKLNPRVTAEFKRSMVSKSRKLAQELQERKGSIENTIKGMVNLVPALKKRFFPKASVNSYLKLEEFGHLQLFNNHYWYPSSGDPEPKRYSYTDALMMSIDCFTAVFSMNRKERAKVFENDSTLLLNELYKETGSGADTAIEQIQQYQTLVASVLSANIETCTRCNKVKF